MAGRPLIEHARIFASQVRRSGHASSLAPLCAGQIKIIKRSGHEGVGKFGRPNRGPRRGRPSRRIPRRGTAAATPRHVRPGHPGRCLLPSAESRSYRPRCGRIVTRHGCAWTLWYGFRAPCGRRGFFVSFSSVTFHVNNVY
jgi:hypothetical protein